MILRHIPADEISTMRDLSRSVASRVFEDRLRESIEEIGLVEPIKVAEYKGKYIVVDGVMRWNAIQALRSGDASLFTRVPAYVLPFSKRYELRYQTDIYQDLLPSQLAALVEHLHANEGVSKRDIARYIGVSAATLRNYTGLWRLVQRGGLFKRIVDLMDVGVLPASNPFAWLRLTSNGLRIALEGSFTGGATAEDWTDTQIQLAARGSVSRIPIKFVETATGSLGPEHYRQGELVRALKRDLGLRRRSKGADKVELKATVRHLAYVLRESQDPVIQSAAKSLREFIA